MKIKSPVHIFVAVLFVVFAGLQINDPDPLLWILLYLLVALIAGLASFGKFPFYLILAVLLFSFIWLLLYVPHFITWVTEGAPSIVSKMKAETPHIELVREFLGIFIAFIAVLYYFQRAKKVRK